MLKQIISILGILNFILFSTSFDVCIGSSTIYSKHVHECFANIFAFFSFVRLLNVFSLSPLISNVGKKFSLITGLK